MLADATRYLCPTYIGLTKHQLEELKRTDYLARQEIINTGDVLDPYIVPIMVQRIKSTGKYIFPSVKSQAQLDNLVRWIRLEHPLEKVKTTTILITRPGTEKDIRTEIEKPDIVLLNNGAKRTYCLAVMNTLENLGGVIDDFTIV
jgi:hypothetical protein